MVRDLAQSLGLGRDPTMWSLRCRLGGGTASMWFLMLPRMSVVR